MASLCARFGKLLLIAGMVLSSMGAVAQPVSLGPLWRGDGGEVRVVLCPPGADTDAYCRALAIRTATQSIRLGGGYMSVSLLWQRDGGRSGPDALVLGDTGGSGGSGGDADLFAVTLRPEVRFAKWSGERFDSVAVRPGGQTLRLTLPFNLEYFNDALHAGVIIVPLPVLWAGDGLVLDRAAALGRHRILQRRSDRTVVRRELRAWVAERLPHGRDRAKDPAAYTPRTVELLVGLMLSGHADQAKRLLAQRWPRRAGDRAILTGLEGSFWAAVCQVVVTHPHWRTFGLAQLPHADIIQRGAAMATLPAR